MAAPAHPCPHCATPTDPADPSIGFDGRKRCGTCMLWYQARDTPASRKHKSPSHYRRKAERKARRARERGEGE
jgi:hypothetical protein